MNIALLHYSVPPIVGGVESVIAHHARSYDTAQTIDALAHLEGLLTATRQAHAQTARDRLRLLRGEAGEQGSGLGAEQLRAEREELPLRGVLGDEQDAIPGTDPLAPQERRRTPNARREGAEADDPRRRLGGRRVEPPDEGPVREAAGDRREEGGQRALLEADDGEPVHSATRCAAPVTAASRRGAPRHASSRATPSTWWVCGKRSRGWTAATRRPAPAHSRRSRAKVAGSHET